MYSDDVIIHAIADNLIYWTNSWQLKINFVKFHMIHIGHKNSNFEYYLDRHKSDV